LHCESNQVIKKNLTSNRVLGRTMMQGIQQDLKGINLTKQELEKMGIKKE
jgi:hypothetical protein